MRTSNEEYWTLTQAAAWVVFRSDLVVGKFARPAPNSWAAFLMYPTMRPEFQAVGCESQLFDALRTGKVTAYGRRAFPGAPVEPIPPIEWLDMASDLTQPYRTLPSGAKDIPWSGILLKRGDVERHWRRTTEVDSRTRYDWNAIEAFYHEAKSTNPDYSQNELIKEIEGLFQERYPNKKVPSRTSIQNHIKRWAAKNSG